MGAHVIAQAYGEIRTMYTACKHRGFVIISFYDLRAACLAMHSLQGASLQGLTLGISFPGRKEGAADQDEVHLRLQRLPTPQSSCLYNHQLLLRARCEGR